MLLDLDSRCCQPGDLWDVWNLSWGPAHGHRSWGAFSEAVLFSSFYVSQVLGLGSPPGGKHASAQLRKEKRWELRKEDFGKAVRIKYHLFSPPGPGYSVIYPNWLVKLATHLANMSLYSAQYPIFCFILLWFWDRVSLLHQTVLNLWDSSDSLNQLPQKLEL